MILNPFKGKNIVITGGSKGIGLEMAKEFARLKANVAIIARDKAVLDEAQREIEHSGDGVRCLAYACDVTDADTLSDYINMIRYEFGSIDGLIANSGYCHPGYFHKIELADLDRQLDVNVKGVLYTLRLGIPHLLDNDGGFMAITSSPAGNAGIFGFGAYGPTKAALNNLSYVMRQEYAERNIRVHLLLPPDTDTPGYKLEVPMYPRETKAILDGGQLLEPDKVAKIFVQGIANNKKVIPAGSSTKLLLRLMRYAPFIWDAYTRRKVKAAQRYLEEVVVEAEIVEAETEETPVAEETPPETPEPETTTEDIVEDNIAPDEPEVEEAVVDEEPVVEAAPTPEPEPEPVRAASPNGWVNVVESKVSIEFEDLRPFLERITKYAIGLDRSMPEIFTGIAELESNQDRSWELDTQFEGRHLSLRMNAAMNGNESVQLSFDVPMKLAMIIEQERDRIVGY